MAVSNLTINLIAYCPITLNLVTTITIRSYKKFGRAFDPPYNLCTLKVTWFVKALYLNRFRGKPAISSLFGLSPLFTIHLSIMQHTRVRSFFVSRCNLTMNRSLDFGSYIYNYRIFELLAFTTHPLNKLMLAINIYLLTHDAKGIISHLY